MQPAQLIVIQFKPQPGRMAAKQMATKAKIGPPVVDMNMPNAAITSVTTTQACWYFHLLAMAAKPYIAMIEMIHGIELNRPQTVDVQQCPRYRPGNNRSDG